MNLTSPVSAKSSRRKQCTPVVASRLNSNVLLKSGGPIPVAVTPAPIQEWNPASPRGEVITHVRCEADEPAIGIDFWMKLHASKKFQPAFEVATIPAVSPHNSAQHVPIRSTQQCEIVGFSAAEGSHADPCTGF